MHLLTRVYGMCTCMYMYSDTVHVHVLHTFFYYPKSVRKCFLLLGTACRSLHLAGPSTYQLLLSPLPPLTDLSSPCGENVLYFGCRHKQKDFLYQKELGKWAVMCRMQSSLRYVYSKTVVHMYRISGNFRH